MSRRDVPHLSFLPALATSPLATPLPPLASRPLPLASRLDCNDQRRRQRQCDSGCHLSVTDPLALGDTGEAQFVLQAQPNPGIATMTMLVEIASGAANQNALADDGAIVEGAILYQLLLPPVAR
ncbi:hypothetical protein Rcas_0942 [Roseiflexus castenholzii DSM 13941]|uniref:Uncharacterized protein n=1 Tax=Roseiflexus castenholzii (strain DSM 13941 / HLO8) TaxID=383372 RepID=A7NHV9_ROSCS|nr:hypothetical protein Rcas_0942 [Roseiflexus castenholzii DSM 13941]